MDVIEGLKRIQEAGEMVDCIMTSPPYWGLRDYGVDGQLGLEKHPKEYIENLVKVFRESKKVLKDSGSLWLNLGDTYFGSWGNMSREQTKDYPKGRPPSSYAQKDVWLKPKQKMLIPHRTAIALQDDGWLLRNEVIWHKPSHMPSSVRDRLSNSFEYLFHFVKQKKYFYDLDSIREPHKTKGKTRGMTKKLFGGTTANREGRVLDNGGYSEAGKNPGDLWSINPKPFPEAHFACYPTTLCSKPLLATCPNEVCKKCGVARERIIKKEPSKWKDKSRKHKTEVTNFFNKKGSGGNPGGNWKRTKEETIGWSDCGCGKGFEPGVVLDPFVGSGTTLQEAQNQKKAGIGIEINKEYIKLIRKRLNGGEHQASLNPNKIEVISELVNDTKKRR